MASIAQSNTRFLNMMQSNSHAQHALKGKHLFGNWKERLKHQFGFDVWKLPVCMGCEGWALWDKDDQGNGIAQCPSCGKTTKNPITVQEYYEQGFHVDRTALGKDKPHIIDREYTKGTSTVFGGEVGLADANKKIIIARR